MSEKKDDCCGAPTLVFACSGATDVGAIADGAARQMTRDGVARMFCLAGIGGRVNGILETTRAAEKILAIDGCSADCVKHCLELAGFTDFEHVRVSDQGMEKGSSPVSPERIAAIAAMGTELIA